MILIRCQAPTKVAYAREAERAIAQGVKTMKKSGYDADYVR